MPPPGVEDAVYQAVLLDLVREAPMTELYVAKVTAAHPPQAGELLERPELAGLLSETVEDFRARIPESPTPMLMVQPDELNNFCFMPAPCKREPGHLRGALEFSAIGFNCDHTQALVYATFGIEGGCAGGYYYLLRRVEARWDVMKSIQILIS
jgi:hypothetical protein